MTNEELVAELRNLHRAYVGTGNGTSHHAKIILQAANTIEELSRTDKVGTWLELDSCVWYCSECGGFGCGAVMLGMNMPESCARCQLLEGGYMDGLCHGANMWLDDERFLWRQHEDGDVDDSKPLNCPLIPLPENTLFIVRDGILYEQQVVPPVSDCITFPPIYFEEDKS